MVIGSALPENTKENNNKTIIKPHNFKVFKIMLDFSARIYYTIKNLFCKWHIQLNIR